MNNELAIKGGTVVSARGRHRAHIYVSDGRIVHVGDHDEQADRVVDATGLSVLPGMVDTHVHLMDPGATDREDFPTGTAAAAVAGVTTIVEHTHANPLRSVADLREKLAYLEGRSNIDFGLAAHTWPDRIDDLGALWEAGVTFFKIFTCTTHGVPGLDAARLEEALAAMASFGGVCLIHCEDETMTADAEAKLREQGRNDNGILNEWRTLEAEEVAVAVAAALAERTGARATIAHVSSPSVADIITEARGRGADLVAEACPQYFTLREDEVLTEGPLRKFTPPTRSRSDADEEKMWDLLRTGVLNHVSTDHAPSTRQQKQHGIWDAPFGLPGLDTTTPFLFDAVHRRRLSLEDVVRVYSEAPAKRYGLFPRKGHLGVGADADLVLVDEERSWTVSDDDVISKAGWSPYTGRKLIGRVHTTYLRGRLIASDRSPIDGRDGRFVPGAGAVSG
ncbi:MAG: amidohydrolase family protein [Acidimicrobiia bacterium]